MNAPFRTRRRALTASAALLAAWSSRAARAQSAGWPSRPITIVAAFPVGGDTDVLARMFAEKLSTRLGQPVIVENRTGASGTIGTVSVARAPGDGHTLLLAPNTMVITPHVIKAGAGSQYDPVADFTPIVNVGTVSLFLVVTAASGVKSVPDLVAAVKAGRIRAYASPGSGSPMHVLGELFDRSAGVRIEQVPYRGSAPAVADMLGGHVPMMYTTLGPVKPHIESGKLVPLAVADPQRSPFLPDVPTLSELGYRNSDVGAWQALLGPKNMPRDVVVLLNRHCNEILKMPDVVARMSSIAMTPSGGEPGSLGKLVADEYARYGKLVQEFRITAD